MKKPITDIKYREFIERKRIRNIKKNTKNTKNKYQKNNIVNRKNKKERTFSFNSIFSLINNPKKVISYINQISKFLLSGKGIAKLDFSKTTQATPDAILLLISILKDENLPKHRIIGTHPKDTSVFNVFLETGFYNYVNSQIPKDINKGIIIEHKSHQKADPNIIKEITETICKDLNISGYFQPLYIILSELMNNTDKHASTESSDKKYHWHFQSKYDEKLKLHKSTLLDVGSGIFESDIVKQHKKKNYGIVKERNTDLLKRMLEGKERVTKTEKQYRGTGLKTVFDKVTSNKEFYKFILISNDVYVSIKESGKQCYNTKNTANNFKGTALYWEMQNENN